MPSRFSEHVLAQEEHTPYLPCFHTTDSYCLRDIVIDSNGKILPDPHQGRAYFFYGRPCYRIPSDPQTSTKETAEFPTCLVLSPGCVHKLSICGIYPFDSGAFINALYAPYFHPQMELEDFKLEASPSTPPKVVTAFYGTNMNYYLGQPLEDIEFDALEFELQSYYKLLKSGGRQNFDDRSSAIEIQTQNEVTLSKGDVLAVVVPVNFMDNEAFRTVIVGQWNATPITYQPMRTNISGLTSTIIEEVRKFLTERNLLI